MLKRFLIEVGIIAILWVTHCVFGAVNNTARHWFDAVVVMFAAKGIFCECKDMTKKEGEQ